MNIVQDVLSNYPCEPSCYSAKQLLRDRRVIVYGAGEGYTALKRTVFNPLGITASLIVDQKFELESQFDGVRSVNAKALQQLYTQFEDCAVIISLGNTSAIEDVKLSMLDLGFSEVFWAPDIYEYALHHPNQEIEKNGVDHFLQHTENINAVYESLEDQESRDLFKALLTRYMTGVPNKIPSAPFEEQYLPKGICLNKGSEHYVSCGAFDGDSIRKIVGAHGKRSSVFAFEPDEDNFAKMTSYIASSLGCVADTVACFPCGVFSETRQLRFASGNGLSSTIDQQGETVIQVVSIDQALANTLITYMTMDVEGAELDALSGAENLLKTRVPDLAISVYHYPEHLWHVAGFLKSLDVGYKFYLRNYSGFTYETLLYATSERKSMVGE